MSLLRRCFGFATDLLGGLDDVLGASALRGLAWTLCGLVVGWWIYVPIHELFHVLGCVLFGGTVTELEIAPLYGGRLWAQIFPFVTAGGEYAGRLSGFDTRGSDFVYLTTVLAPYALTLFPAGWWLALARRRTHAFAWGALLPIALAPILSLLGDAYEIGSIVVTWLPAFDVSLRGDDVLAVASRLEGGAAWLGWGLSFLVGAVWAVAVTALANELGRVLTRTQGAEA